MKHPVKKLIKLGRPKQEHQNVIITRSVPLVAVPEIDEFIQQIKQTLKSN